LNIVSLSLLTLLALPTLVHAAGAVELTTPVSGVVSEVLVHEHVAVRRGQVLARLDATLYQAGLAEAQAEQARASAEADEAQRALERAEELYRRAVSSTTELDAARLDRARARASLDATGARVAAAKKRLADTELKAPFDGKVIAIPGQVGTVVSAECQPRTLVILGR
jgi:RND family efflux transporter MFP subunit